MIRLITIISVTLACLYILFAILLVLLQDRFIFFPTALSPGTESSLSEHPSYSSLSLTVSGDVRLHGWIHSETKTDSVPLLIYFGGNAEEVSWTLQKLSRTVKRSVAAFNYRGYGLSEGRPGQKALYSDALDIYDTLARREGINPNRIAVMGFSLGSAMAVHVAAKRKVDAVILLAPFDSLVPLGQTLYPIYPVNLLLRHPFNSIEKAPQCRSPLLCFMGEADSIIPSQHSERLHNAWGGSKTVVRIPGAGHEDLLSWPGLVEQVNRFLE